MREFDLWNFPKFLDFCEHTPEYKSVICTYADIIHNMGYKSLVCIQHNESVIWKMSDNDFLLFTLKWT
jgi:hypothetical protein